MWWTSFVVLSWRMACIVDVSRHMTSSGMKRGEQSGSPAATVRRHRGNNAERLRRCCGNGAERLRSSNNAEIPREQCGKIAEMLRKLCGKTTGVVRTKCGTRAVPLRTRRRSALLGHHSRPSFPRSSPSIALVSFPDYFSPPRAKNSLGTRLRSRSDVTEAYERMQQLQVE